MRSRTALIGALIVATAVVAAGVASGFGPAGAAQQAQPQTNETITVGASGQVQTQADKAVVRVAVVATGDDVETVRERLSTNASSMRSALSEMGINGSQVQTAYYDISSNRRYGVPAESDQPAYRAVHSFSITVNETDRAGEVIDTAVTNGANEVDGVEFTLSADKRQNLREQALRSAMDAARGEAGAIADQSDLTVTGVNRVSTTEYSRSTYQTEALAADGGGGGTSIESGPVTVSASVTVVYDATEASTGDTGTDAAA